MTKTWWIRTLCFMVVPLLLAAGSFLSGTRADDPSEVSMSVEPDISQIWPQFRGTNAAGVATEQDLPLNWDVKTGDNIRWKRAIPGLGHSSPVVWGDKVFVTTAVGEGKEAYLKVGRYGESPDNPEDYDHHYKVYCLDRTTGEIVWEKTAYTGKPKVARHIKSSHANCTPATDGKHLLVFFASQGLYCYDLEGKLLWTRDLGYLDAGAFDVPDIQWGFASSPIIYQDKVLVLCDVNNQSFITALDLESGKDIWRTLRDENPTWGTPTVHASADRTQVIVNGYKHIGGYEVETGKAIWWMRGGGDVPCPTPVVAHGLVFITNAHGRMRPIYAIRLEAEGDISLDRNENSNRYIPWSFPRRGSYQPTPLVLDDLLYVADNGGILTCYTAVTGEEKYREKIGGDLSSYSASPVAVDGRLYFTDEFGTIFIVKAGPQYEFLTKNSMDEVCMATPAISHKTLFIRGRRHLFAIGQVGD
ncbi:MAG: PQQ-binding-like beta-propeller repeat protein [Candidatus Aminicenantaceae bacterium]